MSSLRTAVTTVVALGMLAACSPEPDPVPAAPDPTDAGYVAVSAEAPTAPLVLDPMPSGADVLRVVRAPADEAGDGLSLSGATVYASAGDADSLAGPLLLIGTNVGSANASGGPTRGDGAHDVDLDIGFGNATYVPAGDRAWVVIPLGYEDVFGFVIGSKISEADLIEAARGADFLATPPTVAAADLPAGLQPAVSGRPGDGPRSDDGELVELVVDGARVTISAVAADPRLAALWGFWLDPDGTDTGRGRAGWLVDSSGAYGEVWSEDGTVISVVGNVQWPAEIDPAALRATVGAVASVLRTGTESELEAMGAAVVDPLTAAELELPEGVVVSGRTGEVRWGCSVHLTAPTLDVSTGTATVARGLRVNRDGLAVPLDAPDQITMDQTMYSGDLEEPDRSGWIIGGVAPRGTARLVILSTDDRAAEAVLAPSATGDVVFCAHVAGEAPVGSYSMQATALDAEGQLIDQAQVPW